MKEKDVYKNSFDECSLTYALSVIGGKWRLPILWALNQQGPVRYNELKRSIHGITNMMLTQSLKELESYHIIHRQQYLEVPPRVEYSLTEHGESLMPTLIALAKWGKNVKNSLS